jgi:O-antigen/teichoic acid export membrane protein
MSDFRQRTIASGASALSVRTLQAALSLGAGVVLARLLSPADFGVFAMVVPLGVIASNVGNQCVQTALLETQELSPEEVDTFFWLVVRINTLVAVAMALCGWGLAAFYDEPRVIGIAAAWAVLISLLVPTTFREAQLKRDLRFPTVMSVQLASLVLGIACAVTAAWMGAGYWALPIQLLVMEAGRAAGIFVIAPRRLSGTRTSGNTAITQLRKSWLSIVGLRLAMWLRELPDIVAVGRMGGAVALGNYATAKRWAWYPFEDPFLALTDVTLSALQRVRDDASRFRHLVSRLILVMLTASLPIIAFVAIEAESVVLVVLGDQWAEAVPFLRILCVAAFAGAIARTSHWIYLALGRNNRLLAWSLFVQTPATIVAVVVGLRWGAHGVATGLAVVAVVLLLPALAYGVRGTSLSLLDIIRAVARPTVASLLGAGLLVLSHSLLPANAGFPRLVAGLALFCSFFLISWHGIPGGIRDTKALLAVFQELFRPRPAPK